MNPELESLIEAYDKVIQAQGSESERLIEFYEARLAGVLERHPTLSRDGLEKTIHLAHSRWARAQEKPSSIPPKA